MFLENMEKSAKFSEMVYSQKRKPQKNCCLYYFFPINFNGPQPGVHFDPLTRMPSPMICDHRRGKKRNLQCNPINEILWVFILLFVRGFLSVSAFEFLFPQRCHRYYPKVTNIPFGNCPGFKLIKRKCEYVSILDKTNRVTMFPNIDYDPVKLLPYAKPCLHKKCQHRVRESFAFIVAYSHGVFNVFSSDDGLFDPRFHLTANSWSTVIENIFKKRNTTLRKYHDLIINHENWPKVENFAVGDFLFNPAYLMGVCRLPGEIEQPKPPLSVKTMCMLITSPSNSHQSTIAFPLELERKAEEETLEAKRLRIMKSLQSTVTDVCIHKSLSGNVSLLDFTIAGCCEEQSADFCINKYMQSINLDANIYSNLFPRNDDEFGVKFFKLESNVYIARRPKNGGQNMVVILPIVNMISLVKELFYHYAGFWGLPKGKKLVEICLMRCLDRNEMQMENVVVADKNIIVQYNTHKSFPDSINIKHEGYCNFNVRSDLHRLIFFISAILNDFSSFDLTIFLDNMLKCENIPNILNLM